MNEYIKKCRDCGYCEYFGDYSLYYCKKYNNAQVELNDYCIEIGMEDTNG